MEATWSSVYDTDSGLIFSWSLRNHGDLSTLINLPSVHFEESNQEDVGRCVALCLLVGARETGCYSGTALRVKFTSFTSRCLFQRLGHFMLFSPLGLDPRLLARVWIAQLRIW